VTGLRDTAVDRLRRIASAPAFTTGRYALGDEIGRGGMGIVYGAIDTELGREVAVKIPAGVVASGVERRLQREARVLAALEHPGIVPIHDIGRLEDGRPFYVMKRVRGRTLRDHLRDVATLPERLRIFERICEPVAFAHQAGVVHRDLKPENVMIGAFGEVLVMDWGLALVDGAGEEAGLVAGTPGFMPPEQARGDAAAADVRADIFALGAILFLLVAGSDPAPDYEAAEGLLRERGLPAPLRAICARAMHPEPAGRYQDVAALSADVVSFAAGGAVSVHRESLVEWSVRAVRTHRVAIVLVLAYLVMRVAVAMIAGR
jgi:serine/threonine protein kinase